jgi:hypothetical protein
LIASALSIIFCRWPGTNIHERFNSIRRPPVASFLLQREEIFHRAGNRRPLAVQNPLTMSSREKFCAHRKEAVEL